MGALGWNDMNNGPEAGPLFVMVTLNLRTASPPEADRSLRGREACLLGDIITLYPNTLLQDSGEEKRYGYERCLANYIWIAWLQCRGGNLSDRSRCRQAS